MKIDMQDLFQVQESPMLLDKTINKAYIKAIKCHIELLEEKKREFEYQMLSTDTPNIDRGIVTGLNLAIEQLYNDINRLKDK